MNKCTRRHCQQVTAVPAQGIGDELYFHQRFAERGQFAAFVLTGSLKLHYGDAWTKLMSCAYAVTPHYAGACVARVIQLLYQMKLRR